jgi:AraC family transcriptional regulator, L-rhamnose operon transcriptional activator RhaR
MRSAASYSWKKHYPASDVVHVNLVVRNGKRVLHTHDYAEIALMIRGEGEFRSAPVSRIVSKGSLVVVPPGVEHTYTNCRSAHILFCCIRPEIIESVSLSLNMKPSVWAEIGLVRSEGQASVSAWQIRRDLVPLYAETLAEIQDTHRQRGIRAQFARVGGLFSFLGLVLAQHRARSGIEEEQDGVQLHALTARALSFLRNDLTRQWTMRELCKCLNDVHPVHLCRVFKHDMNMTPMSYLRHLRCQEAAHLLASSSVPVGAIGSTVGWDDPNLFSRRFRAVCGVSPSEYRIQHGRP